MQVVVIGAGNRRRRHLARIAARRPSRDDRRARRSRRRAGGELRQRLPAHGGSVLPVIGAGDVEEASRLARRSVGPARGALELPAAGGAMAVELLPLGVELREAARHRARLAAADCELAGAPQEAGGGSGRRRADPQGGCPARVSVARRFRSGSGAVENSPRERRFLDRAQRRRVAAARAGSRSPLPVRADRGSVRPLHRSRRLCRGPGSPCAGARREAGAEPCAGVRPRRQAAERRAYRYRNNCLRVRGDFRRRPLA